MWTAALWNHPIMLLQWGAVLGASLVAAAVDLRTRRIPNLLTGLLFLAGLADALIFKGGDGLLDSIAGALLLGVPFVVLFVIAGGGAGDAKMMAAIGAWVGIANGVIVLLAVTVTGAILGIAYAAAKNRLKPVLANLNAIVLGLMSVAYTKGGSQAGLPNSSTHELLTVPYGLSIFVGTCLALGGRLLWPA